MQEKAIPPIYRNYS